ncbi:BatA domain-containing protein [Winogradskyella sp. A2]|uniref:BatA domain-containing protein n=1 Tax=Winogradskyella sp. A2 TaxID=3366944 RepID=UPI00398C3B84
MQFKHPELLYALFLLIIPILIHLFQLRRFQKVEFTNVKFLKAVKLQTRKSSQIKKWLTLLTRLLLLTSVIIAFAQPFISKTDKFNQKQETVIYLDNSFSMEAKGRNGSLLNEAIQDLINTVPEDEKISVYTNDKLFTDTSIKAIKKDLINLPYSNNQINYGAVILKGKQMFSNDGSAEKNLILVSDFQQKSKPLDTGVDSIIGISLVQPISNLIANVSIDSIYIADSNAETLDLNVRLTSYGDPIDNISISLFDNDELLAKNSVNIENETEATFTITNNTEINGKLVIEDAGLQYDNVLYFNIGKKPKIKVLVINENSSDDFLNRIFTDDEFEFNSFNINALNFNLIKDQDLIIINELESISSALISALDAFKTDGRSVLIIPSNNISLNTYNQLFKKLNLSLFVDKINSTKRITTINYDHPLLLNSFYTRVTNFQYPRVDFSFKFASNINGVLSYDDGSTFFQGINGSYVFASAINSDNSNFQNSPLIVPVLYNIGLQSLKLPKLFYTIGAPNSIAIETNIGQDDILSLHSNDASVIPPQKTFSKYVILETQEFPTDDGLYSIKNDDENLQNISFNYDRTESNINYININALDNISIDNSLSKTINTIKSNANVNALWKWFVIFALVFLIIEILILKYLK